MWILLSQHFIFDPFGGRNAMLKLDKTPCVTFVSIMFQLQSILRNAA